MWDVPIGIQDTVQISVPLITIGCSILVLSVQLNRSTMPSHCANISQASNLTRDWYFDLTKDTQALRTVAPTALQIAVPDEWSSGQGPGRLAGTWLGSLERRQHGGCQIL